MESVDLKRVNEIMDDYVNYLAKYNPIFLDNSVFFYKLTQNYQEFKVVEEDMIYPKINATDSFKLVKEFYMNFYKEEIEKIESLFNSGVFEIYYVSELKEEKIYLNRMDITFRQGKNQGHSFIKLPLLGDIRDVHLIIHEIRHQLNEPDNCYRNIDNDTLTETLSMFDEILALDYFKDRLSEETYIGLKKYYYANFYKLFSVVNFISELLIVKNKLGYINIENYKMLFGSVDEENVKHDLMRFIKLHKSFNSIDAEIKNWYVFGMFIISFMHQEYIKDYSYLEKVKKLNESVKNNKPIDECLSVVGINLNDSDIIQKLRERLIIEISDVKENVKKV